AREEIRPDAEAENAKPRLRIGYRGDGDAYGGAARALPPRLIEDVHGEAAAEKDALVAFPPIRGRLPGCTQAPMPHHQRQLSRIGRNVELDVGVIAVKCLPIGRRRELGGVKSTR